MINELSQRFIHTYNELDSHMDNKVQPKRHTSHTELLKIMAKRNSIIRNNLDELLAYARLRNVIVHESTSQITPIAEPHKKIVKHYEDILEALINPKDAMDIAKPRHKLKMARLDDKVLETIRIMKKYKYTYMPIIQKKELLGVFSPVTLFTYVAENEKCPIDENLTISQLGSALDLDMQFGQRIEFVSRHVTDIDIIDMFSQDIKDEKRLALIFVTENGKKSEGILGMISSWDVFDYMDDYRIIIE